MVSIGIYVIVLFFIKVVMSGLMMVVVVLFIVVLVMIFGVYGVGLVIKKFYVLVKVRDDVIEVGEEW